MALSKEISISALSRPFHLGMLYDACSDQIVPGVSIWKAEDIKKATRVCPQPNTRFQVAGSESLSQKTKLLDISASVKLSFLSGLIEAAGSAHYLKNQTASRHQCSLTLHYHQTTEFRELMITELEMPRPEVFDMTEATHVVVSILYGADALMEFQDSAINEESRKEIQGNLKMMIKKIPETDIGGDGSLKMNNEDREKVQNFSCKFYGDVCLDSVPSTYEGAVKLYNKLPCLLGENGEKAVPVKVWLYPLNKLNNTEMKLKSMISETLVDELEQVMEDFHEAKMRTNDLLEQSKKIKVETVAEKLKEFQGSLSGFSIVFLKKISELISATRRGEEKEIAIRDLLRSQGKHGFCKGQMKRWLNHKEIEINTVMNYMSLDCVVKSPGPELQSYLFQPGLDDVYMFSFTSLEYEEPYLAKVKLVAEDIKNMSSNDASEQEPKQEDLWCMKADVKNGMDISLSVFKELEENARVISFISDPQHPGASLRWYHKSVLKDPHVTSTHVPPPGPIQFVSVQSVSVSFRWSPPKGVPGHRTFMITWTGGQQHGSHVVTDEDETVVTGLTAGKKYHFTVATLRQDGRQSTPVEGAVHTTLLPPGAIECKVLTPTSVSLSWTPAPLDGPTDGLKYSVAWRGERSGEQHRTVTPVTQLEVQNLHPGDAYEFTVATISDSGGESQSVSVSQCMNIPAPENLTLKKNYTSADLSWTAPSSMERIPHTFLVCYGCKGGKAQFLSTTSCSAVITGLQPHTEYDVKVRVVCGKGTESRPVTMNFHTVEDSETLWVKSLTPTSVEVNWTPSEELNQTARSFQISYVCDGTEPKTITTDSCSAVIDDLKPDSEYLFSVSAASVGEHPMMLGSTIFCTDVPTAGPIQIISATPTSVSLMWKALCTDYGYRVTRKCSKFESTFTVWGSGITIHDLDPGDELDITVFTLRNKQQSSSSSHLKYLLMKLPQPTDLQLDVHRKMLTWKKPAGVDRVSYLLTVTKQGANMFNAFTEKTQYPLPEDAFKTDCSCVIYVSTVLKSAQSIPNVVAIDQYGVVTYPDKEAHPAHSQITPTPPSHAVTNTGKEERPINHQARQAPGYAEFSTAHQMISHGTLVCRGTVVGKHCYRRPAEKKYYLHASGKTKSYCSDIQNLWLRGLSEVKSVDSAHMILAICMVVSRVGTDVKATLREIPVNKPTVLVVMHHTFDPAYVVPDSRRYAKGDDMLVVGCLFHEDQGLLRCETNDKAKTTVLNWIERKIVGIQAKTTTHSQGRHVNAFDVEFGFPSM